LVWFVLFVANVQTGFGPFISVYLTTQKWTQVDIGLVLTVGSLAALVSQIPGGMLVDIVRSERLLSGTALALIAGSAVAFVAMPVFPVIAAAAVLHSAASCVLGPAMAAISLGLVGHAAIGERLGRNARYASIGNGLAAISAARALASAIFTKVRLLRVPLCRPPYFGRFGRFEPCAGMSPPRWVGVDIFSRLGASFSSQPRWPFRRSANTRPRLPL
jgi:MFS family permease